METIVQTLGRFVAAIEYDRLPEAVQERAKSCLLNGIGIGFAGYDIPFAQIARKAAATDEAQADGARLWLDGRRVTLGGAAFANSVLCHSRVQEDCHGASHYGAIIIPTLLAIAEREPVTAKDALAALVAGYEVGGALGRQHTALSTPRGFRATAIYGIFAATATAARALRLGAAEAAHALAFAAGFSSGTVETFLAGSMEFLFQAGLAARNGLLCAQLARHGVKGAATAIEGDKGFLRAFAGTTERAGTITDGLGEQWETLNVGFKFYPVCMWVQSPIATMLRLRSRVGLEPEQVRRIALESNRFEAAYPGNDYQGPYSTIEQTLMSAPYCVAAACVDGRFTYAGLRQFDHPAINALARKVEIVPTDRPQLTTRLIVETTDGAVYDESIDRPDLYTGLTYGEVTELVRSLVPEMPTPPDTVERLADVVAELDQRVDLAAVREIVGRPAVAVG